MQANRFEFNRKFHQKGSVPRGMRTFGMIAQTSPQIEWGRTEGSQRHMVAFPANDEFEFISHPGFGGDTVSIPEDRLYQVAECLGLLDHFQGLPNDQAMIESEPARIEAFRKQLSRLHLLAKTSTIRPVDEPTIADVEFEAITALLEALSADRGVEGGTQEPATRSRAIRIALDYIEDHASEPPSIEEVCRRAGVSWRTLNYAFRERFGLTSKQYLQAFRFKRVRRDLLGNGPEIAISEIAAGWGFWHMGQFAADYRRHFGELPSETVRRS